MGGLGPIADRVTVRRYRVGDDRCKEVYRIVGVHVGPPILEQVFDPRGEIGDHS
jgi:hypothetical protein